MKLQIALVTGGYTAERDVSLKSAAFVEASLDEHKYEVFKIVINQDTWAYHDRVGNLYPIDRSNFSLALPNKVVYFDMAFIMIHGCPGEDGRLQGYFDLLGIPYTSCDTATSAITMNKSYTKAALANIEGLSTAPSVLLFERNRKQAFQLIRTNLTLPCIVKPNNGGSSIGASKVTRIEDLHEAIEKAFNAIGTGRQVIVEEFVDGREFSVGIYRRKTGVHVLPVTEVLASTGFYDFNEKYIAAHTNAYTPAVLAHEQLALVTQLVKTIYERLDCRGMVRVDFFIERQTGKFYFIEVNTIPGQTDHSFIPKQIEAEGRDIAEFYDEIIEMAIENQHETSIH